VTCHRVVFLWVWYVKRALRNLGTKTFDLFVLILGLCLYVYLSSQKERNCVFYILGTRVFSSVQVTIPAFLVFIFMVLQSFENKKNDGVAIDEPPRGSANRPVVHSCNHAFCYRLPVLHKLVRLLFKCYWFYACVYEYVLFYNYVQLARSFKLNSCSHASPLRSKFSVPIIRCQKLLSTESGSLKIWRELLKPFETAMSV
jgi:hypothetical protein